MDVVRIAHISDLHFSPGKTMDVWQSVSQFINGEVKPHVVLVTGDVTDNAKHEEFDFALSQLAYLQPHHGDGDSLVYRIVPGNHDCYAYRGNTLPWVSKYVRDKECRFAAKFKAHVLDVAAPFDIEPKCGAADWKIRVIGLDSNHSKQFFAQGYVEGRGIEKAVIAARGSEDRDLVIALVHHHVLPIAALEQERSSGGDIKQLATVTGLLNSGTLLSALSRSRVDLVLHGHEHKQNQARFGCIEEGASDVVVLAAGSATGAATFEGYSLKRVHLNVLELQDDRSIWLREVGLTGDGVLGYLGERRMLISAQQIRQSRFVRRNRKPGTTAAVPRSRLRKLVRFSEERDLEITETRTDWVVSESWTQFSQNGSGHISPLHVICRWAAGPVTEHNEPFLPERGIADRYVARVKLVEGTNKAVEQMTASWTWRGGAALTERELQVLAATNSVDSRVVGREYAAVRANGQFEALSLVVELPYQFAPSPADVNVLVDPGDGSGTLQHSIELARSIEFCGAGYMELRIPYPMPEYEYYITWPAAKNLPAPSARQFCSAAKHRYSEMLGLCLDRLAPVLYRTNVRLHLYLPHDQPDFSLYCVPSHASGVPASISLSKPRSLARLAWLGSPTAFAARNEGAPSHADDEFCDDEVALAWIPLMMSQDREDDGLAMGLVRVGIFSLLNEQGDDLDVLNMLKTLSTVSNDMVAMAFN